MTMYTHMINNCPLSKPEVIVDTEWYGIAAQQRTNIYRIGSLLLCILWDGQRTCSVSERRALSASQPTHIGDNIVEW